MQPDTLSYSSSTASAAGEGRAADSGSGRFPYHQLGLED